MKRFVLLLMLVFAIQNLSFADNSDYTKLKPVGYSTYVGPFKVEKTIYASDQELDMLKKKQEEEMKERFPNGVLPVANENVETQEAQEVQTNDEKTNKRTKTKTKILNTVLDTALQMF